MVGSAREACAWHALLWALTFTPAVLSWAGAPGNTHAPSTWSWARAGGASVHAQHRHAQQHATLTGRSVHSLVHPHEERHRRRGWGHRRTHRLSAAAGHAGHLASQGHWQHASAIGSPRSRSGHVHATSRDWPRTRSEAGQGPDQGMSQGLSNRLLSNSRDKEAGAHTSTDRASRRMMTRYSSYNLNSESNMDPGLDAYNYPNRKHLTAEHAGSSMERTNAVSGARVSADKERSQVLEHTERAVTDQSPSEMALTDASSLREQDPLLGTPETTDNDENGEMSTKNEKQEERMSSSYAENAASIRSTSQVNDIEGELSGAQDFSSDDENTETFLLLKSTGLEGVVNSIPLSSMTSDAHTDSSQLPASDKTVKYRLTSAEASTMQQNTLEQLSPSPGSAAKDEAEALALDKSLQNSDKHKKTARRMSYSAKPDKSDVGYKPDEIDTADMSADSADAAGEEQLREGTLAGQSELTDAGEAEDAVKVILAQASDGLVIQASGDSLSSIGLGKSQEHQPDSSSAFIPAAAYAESASENIPVQAFPVKSAQSSSEHRQTTSDTADSSAAADKDFTYTDNPAVVSPSLQSSSDQPHETSDAAGAQEVKVVEEVVQQQVPEKAEQVQQAAEAVPYSATKSAQASSLPHQHEGDTANWVRMRGLEQAAAGAENSAQESGESPSTGMARAFTSASTSASADSSFRQQSDARDGAMTTGGVVGGVAGGVVGGVAAGVVLHQHEQGAGSVVMGSFWDGPEGPDSGVGYSY